jgi:cell division septation protein DedD
MDWLRRNWPDLAIGVALVAVIAGIIATLLTGGSFFPVAPSQTPMQAQSTPPRGATPAPASDSSGGVRALSPDGLAAPAGTAVPDAAPSEPAAGDPAPTTEAGQAPPATATVTPLAPDPAAVPAAPAASAPAPATAAPAPAASAPAPAAPAPAASAPAPAATAPTLAAPASPAPAAAGVPTPSSDPEAPFRVSVGAYGSAENAERQAAAFRSAGYPVFTGSQGALTIVLVGPYDSENAAEQAMASIRAGGFGIEPVIYRFRPDAPSAAASTPAPAPATATAAPAAPTVSANAAPATTAAGRYLQVGAYGSVESSTPQRDRLAGLGFAASERREDGLIKLLIGPFDQDGLVRARQQLAAQGIESFPR